MLLFLKKIQLIIALVGLTLTGLQAQSVLVASGGNASSSNAGTATYSVGQIAYKSFSSTNGSVTQGVQQPTLVITNLEDEAYTKEISCTVFPNPTATTVNLRIENRSLENMSFHLYDLNGKLLRYQKINQTETILSTEDLLPSIYLLRVRDGNQELKTFRLVKY
jgi:hypothetical protein